MKLCIDESGDVGFKEASSEFFCGALVIFYNYSTSLVINNASEKITEDSEFFIDGSGDRAFRQEISNYLKFKFNDYGKKKIKRIRMVRSESMDEIQLADFLAGCMRRSHE